MQNLTNIGTLRVFSISILVLFIEVAFVRWIGSEINVFAYLQNVVLVICFMGIGLGCLSAQENIRVERSLLALVMLQLLVALPTTHQALLLLGPLLSSLGDFSIWAEGSVTDRPTRYLAFATGVLATHGLLWLVWNVFLPIGQLLGKTMSDHPRPLFAYTVNILGSLIGSGILVLCSAHSLGPEIWFSIIALLYLPFLGQGDSRKSVRFILTALVVIVPVGSSLISNNRIIWSPYQKLQLVPIGEGDYQIGVNNIGYQLLVDMSKSSDTRSIYDVPTFLFPEPDQMLIVGAGAGNDLAGALRGGAHNVTAVDIDPVILELGKRFHPEHPYDNAAVTVVNDDARSFFSRSPRKFDVITFGLLDSHTGVSLANSRLDHYVYTRESLMAAKNLLAPGGIITLTFDVRWPFVADRIAGTLKDVFGSPPLIISVPAKGRAYSATMFIAGNIDGIRQRMSQDRSKADQLQSWEAMATVRPQYATSVTTDNWPYLYLPYPNIPSVYYFIFIPIALVLYRKAKLGKLMVVERGGLRENSYFFLLGSAFLLLEIQTISRSAIVLGSTWQVNAVIISGVLDMVLLANLMTPLLRRVPNSVVGGILILVSAGMYLLEPALLLDINPHIRGVVTAALYTSPLFFSGLLFARAFEKTTARDRALGMNLLGALVGAALQTVTFIVGLKAVLLLVALLYASAVILDIFGEKIGTAS